MRLVVAKMASLAERAKVLATVVLRISIEMRRRENNAPVKINRWPAIAFRAAATPMFDSANPIAFTLVIGAL